MLAFNTHVLKKIIFFFILFYTTVDIKGGPFKSFNLKIYFKHKTKMFLRNKSKVTWMGDKLHHRAETKHLSQQYHKKREIRYHGAISISMITPLHKPHQIVTHNGYIGFCKTMCGFPEHQIRQFCLLTYPQRWKWTSLEKMIFSEKSIS